jgi:FMN phosphatase YigB (HAD superfamily)
MASNAGPIAGARLVGVSIDVLNTMLHIRGFNVGREYQKIVRQAYFDASDPKPGCLLERLYELDTKRLDEQFRVAFKDVAANWPALAGADPTLSKELAKRQATVGGASEAESSAFWRHVVHGAYRRALERGKGPSPLRLETILTDKEFDSVFDALYNGFGSADPYEVFPEAEGTLTLLKKTKRRGLQEISDPTSFAAAGPAAPGRLTEEETSTKTEKALNPYAWHGDTYTKKQKALEEKKVQVYSQRDGKPRLARLSCVTNFDGRIHRVLAGFGLGYFFDDVFTLHEVPRKPLPGGILRAWGNMDPEVKTAVAATGKAPAVPSSDWLHIGDCGADADAAAAAGAKVLLVDPKVGLTTSVLAAALNDLGVRLERHGASSFDQFADAAARDAGVQAHMADILAGVADDASKGGLRRRTVGETSAPVQDSRRVSPVNPPPPPSWAR